MELWIPITIAAAFLQNLRSAAQKHLKAVMGTTGATFVRFGFGFPFALAFVAVLHWFVGYDLPALNASFFGWAALGALGQIAATFLLIHLFSFRNFAVGTAYSRTEPAQAALFALLFLGERARLSTWLATLVAFGGVYLVLRPNFETAGWGVLLPVMSAAGMAVTIIANRKVTGRASVLAMQYYMSVTAMLFLLVATTAAHLTGVGQFRMHWPEWTIVARCVFIGLTATFAQWMIFMGTVRAGAGTVAPMTYGQLLMAVALGWVFFGDRPDLAALAGAGVIIGAGLFLWWRGRVHDRAGR